MQDGTKLGIVLGFLHLAAFSVVFHTVEYSEEAQIQLLYVPFLAADFPLTMLDFFGIDKILHFLRASSYASLAYAFTAPIIVHGFLGSMWWFFIGKLLLLRSNKAVLAVCFTQAPAETGLPQIHNPGHSHSHRSAHNRYGCHRPLSDIRLEDQWSSGLALGREKPNSRDGYRQSVKQH